jgi:hypothetical protein
MVHPRSLLLELLDAWRIVSLLVWAVELTNFLRHILRIGLIGFAFQVCTDTVCAPFADEDSQIG